MTRTVAGAGEPAGAPTPAQPEDSTQREAARLACNQAEIVYREAEAAAQQAEHSYQAATQELSDAHDACLRLDETLPHAGWEHARLRARDRLNAARVAASAAQATRERTRAQLRAAGGVLSHARLALRAKD